MGRFICWLIGHPDKMVLQDAYHREKDGSMSYTRSIFCPRCFKSVDITRLKG